MAWYDLHSRLFRELELLLLYQLLYDIMQDNTIVGAMRPRTVILTKRLSLELLGLRNLMTK